VILDKEHTKEYKRCRNELKKRSSDTLRLQKKAKKGASDNLQSFVDSSMHAVNQQKAELDEVERKSLRVAMIEDRTRFCHFVSMLEPVVKQEYEMMYELGHLQVKQINLLFFATLERCTEQNCCSCFEFSDIQLDLIQKTFSL
jgi:metastasis suppressor protein 1